MRLVIQVAEADDAKAWSILQRHSSAVALPHRTFVVSQEAISALRQAGVKFRLVSDESQTVRKRNAENDVLVSGNLVTDLG